MTITQTVEVPDNRRFIVEAPREVPTGKMQIIIQFPVEQKPKEQSAPAFEPHPCPICREKFQDPVTGEMRYGPETMAGMKEVDDMLAGKIPNTLKSFDSFEEMLADLNSDDDEEDE